jgi:outer membrane protein assembly factor BamE (lipoprotein component of BamABCDE complex)
MRTLVLFILVATLLTGCSPWLPIQNVSVGMTKAEVLQQLGKPTDVAGSGNVEYFWYNPVNRFWQRYYVRMVSGKVESYGPLGSEPEIAR